MSASKSLIVNELLTFLQQRLDLMGSLSVISICSTSFTVAEICSAKELLYRSLNLSGSFVPHRRGDETGTKTLQDIVKVFVETDPHRLPTFVVKELSKLPPLTYEEVDAASLRKDVVALKATLAKILENFEASQVVIAELRDEVAILRNMSIAAAKTGSAATAEAANLPRNTDDGAPTTSNGAPTTPRSLTLQVQPAALAAPPAPAPAPLPRAHTLPAAPAPPRRSAHASGAGPGRTVTVPRRPPAPPPPVQKAPKKAKQPASVDEDGFTLVEKKKRRACRPPRKSQCGTAETDLDSCLPVAVPNTALYVSRLHHSCVALDVTEYVRQKTGNTLRVFKLEPHHYTHFTSFVVRVPRPLMDTIAKEDFWPKGVVFRRFRGTMPRPDEATSTARRPA